MVSDNYLIPCITRVQKINNFLSSFVLFSVRFSVRSSVRAKLRRCPLSVDIISCRNWILNVSWCKSLLIIRCKNVWDIFSYKDRLRMDILCSSSFLLCSIHVQYFLPCKMNVGLTDLVKLWTEHICWRRPTLIPRTDI